MYEPKITRGGNLFYFCNDHRFHDGSLANPWTAQGLPQVVTLNSGVQFEGEVFAVSAVPAGKKIRMEPSRSPLLTTDFEMSIFRIV